MIGQSHSGKEASPSRFIEVEAIIDQPGSGPVKADLAAAGCEKKGIAQYPAKHSTLLLARCAPLSLGSAYRPDR